MRILSWNIGEAHVFDGRTEDGKSYGGEDVEYFLNESEKVGARIISLQETPDPFQEDEISFSEKLGEKSGYFVSGDFHYGKSHINPGNWHSLSILSKERMDNVQFHKLPNPGLRRHWENGDVWVTFDVGFLSCMTNVEGVKVRVLNCHLVPFHYFERDAMDPEFDFIRETVSNSILRYKDEPTLILGDFNYHDLDKMFPAVFREGNFFEVFTEEETAPGRGQQDHILFSRHWELNGYELRKLRADHYQCIADVSLKNFS